MNKQNLIDAMAEAGDISKSAAERALNAFTKSVTDSLSKDEDVILVGFGSFTISRRAARTGRNPQTGQLMQIPSTIVARFRAGKKLKDAINEES